MFLLISVLLALKIYSNICGSQFSLKHLNKVLSLGKNYNLIQHLPPLQALTCYREERKKS